MNHGELITRERFGDCLIHLEWPSPPGGDRDKQTNGNSGVKIQSHYEIKVMTTLSRRSGAERPMFNEAGSIDCRQAADHNASLGSGVWQTCDIRFRTPRWKGDRKVGNARITLWWNGVLVHDDVEVADKTGMSAAEAPDGHPRLPQAHATAANGPVRFSNVWVVRE